MANFFSRLFNTKKTTDAYDNPVEPYQSLNQVQGGPEYYKKIMERMNGQGVGFGDTYASKYANPIIQNSRANFEDYQMPELNSELSATGRRRGSSGFQQIAQAQKEQGLAENDIFSRLQQRNEDQGRSEINQGIQDVGNYANNEASMRDNFSNFRMGIMDKRAGINAQRNANEAAGLQNMVYAGSDAISSLYGGGQGLGQRQAPQVASYGVGNPNVGFGQSGNSYNQRIVQRMAQKGRA